MNKKYLTLLAALLFIFGASEVMRAQDTKISYPNDIENAEFDRNAGKDHFVDLSVVKNGKVYLHKRLLSPTTFEKIVGKHERNSGVTPDNRIVYIRSAADTKFSLVADILRRLGASGIETERVALVVNDKKLENLYFPIEYGAYVLRAWRYQPPAKPKPGNKPSVIEDDEPPPPVVLPQGMGRGQGIGNGIGSTAAPPKEKPKSKRKPYLKNIEVTYHSDNKVIFDGKAYTAASFAPVLKDIFEGLKENKIFKDGTNEVRSYVLLRVPANVLYGDAVKFMDKLYGAGTTRVYILTDGKIL